MQETKRIATSPAGPKAPRIQMIPVFRQAYGIFAPGFILAVLVSGASSGYAGPDDPPFAENAGPDRASAETIAHVSGWLGREVPECSAEIRPAVATQFLKELQERRPMVLDRLRAMDAPTPELRSLLLRQASVLITAPMADPLREALAHRRLTALLTAEGWPPDASGQEEARQMGKIKEFSPGLHLRLLDGRMDDDELSLLLARGRRPESENRPLVAAPPKLLTAEDIRAEYSRRNQENLALQNLKAYRITARRKTATGEEQDLQLFRLRPNRFRLAVRVGGSTRNILTGDGEHSWEQLPGGPLREVTEDLAEPRRYLGEFDNPLFLRESYAFERLEDGLTDNRITYRIAVKRRDGSGYVAGLDAENYREVWREHPDGSTVRYSDFRSVAGVTFAFREEVTDKNGLTTVMELSNLTPNPGFIPALFVPVAWAGPDYFAVERLWASVKPGEVPPQQ